MAAGPDEDAPAGVDPGADVDARDGVDPVLVEDVGVSDASVGDTGVTWEDGEVEVDPEPPGSSDPPPQAARAAINRNANVTRKKRV